MPAPTGDIIVGIDLGTTNSLVAWCDPAHPEAGPRVIPDEAGRALLPSVVRYDARARPVAVGYSARELSPVDPASTVASVKRLMGRSVEDARGDLALLSYGVVEGANRTARVSLSSGRTISPQEVSAHVLRELKRRAEAALGRVVARAVVTVPAYFDDAQRQATRDAGRLAGLEVVRLVAEPTAAALAYGIGLRTRSPEVIAVYDLGGGTFDVTILRVTPSEPGGAGADFFEVLSTAGDTRLGGDDADHMIIRRLLERRGLDSARLTSTDRAALKAGAESAKITLSEAESARVKLGLSVGEIDEELSREEFERLIEPWVERTMSACRRALRDAGLGAGELSRAVLVGGSTRVPLVRRRVGELFGMPAYTALDPDQVVALGAAVQASIIGGGVRDMLLLDVIPLSLGIETMGGAVAKLIIRNSTVPARATEMFSTSADNQTGIKLNILQGEREMAADCRSLGEFELRGIPPMPAGIPQLEVEFLVDANGVLIVNAHERRSGQRLSVQVVPNHGLSREEVERMEGESLAHAREDMTRHRITDLIVNSRLDIKWIMAALERTGTGLDQAYAAQLRRDADALRAMADRAEADWRSVDPDAFHRAKQQLDASSVRLHEQSIAATLRAEG